MSLGKLESVELKEVWENEAKDFTPWLAKSGIQLLSETLGFGLETLSREQAVGNYYADIVCKDDDDNYVLLENQLGKTDHNHLGQLLTYAAGLSAVTIVWIAKKFTHEHRATLDWLNRITDDTIKFYGLEIELLKIGNSQYAPNFKIICEPNNWEKRVRLSAQTADSDYASEFDEYWTNFRDMMKSNDTLKNLHGTIKKNEFKISRGRNYTLFATVNKRANTISVRLDFDKKVLDIYSLIYDSNLRRFTNCIRKESKMGW